MAWSGNLFSLCRNCILVSFRFPASFRESRCSFLPWTAPSDSTPVYFKRTCLRPAPALTFSKAAATTANEGGLPSSEKGYPKLTPTSIYEIFWESFRLQASVGDLLSSANGFNTIARARRGQPWPGRNAPDVSCSIGTKPEGMGGMNVVHRGRNESTNCLDVFFGAREDTVQEFASRSSANLADVSNGVSESRRAMLRKYENIISSAFRNLVGPGPTAEGVGK